LNKYCVYLHTTNVEYAFHVCASLTQFKEIFVEHVLCFCPQFDVKVDLLLQPGAFFTHWQQCWYRFDANHAILRPVSASVNHCWM